MESAIDEHLKCPRTLSRRIHDDYQPPFPMWMARADPDLKEVVMAYLGVQYLGEENKAKALAALRSIVASFSGPDAPQEHDMTYFRDADGHGNLIVVGYWRDPASYKRWSSTSAVVKWWASDERLSDGIGYFREIVSTRAEQFETIYAYTERFPGVGAIMDRPSGEIQEHGYWGSMRERFPLSQTDRMLASGKLAIVHGNPADRGRVVIRGHDNIALIRSGQDWEQTEGAERKLYLDNIEPTLRAGMDFLRDSGAEVGCYSNRFVQNIDLDGNLIEKSYCIGHWRSIDLMERWAESHPTHLKIFTTFFRVANQISKLRLYHECSVFDAGNQLYEYISCHPRTGMMRDAVPAA